MSQCRLTISIEIPLPIRSTLVILVCDPLPPLGFCKDLPRISIRILYLWSLAPAQAHMVKQVSAHIILQGDAIFFYTCLTMSFRPLTVKEKHDSLAEKICLFPAVLREHLENRRTNKLLNIRRDDVSKPIALLDQIHAQIFSLKELDVSAPCQVMLRDTNDW